MRNNYKFSNGIRAYQEELNGEQDFQVADLFTKMEIGDLDMQKLKLKELLGILSNKKELVNQFFNIILFEKNSITGDANYLTLKNSEMRDVIQDFFTLNPGSRNLLTGILSQAAVMLKTMNSSNSKLKTESTIPAASSRRGRT